MIAERSAIVAQGMGVRRGGRWLLRPVAFGVAEGVAGLAGPPGVGKSTLLATFATLRRPHAGALRILGYDTGNSADLRALRARIGYLPGNFAWADNLTVGEFVSYAAYYKRVRSSATRSVLKQLDLEESESTEMALVPPDVRLRAGLAATCVHEPELVLLDDPLHGLDAVEAREIMPLVRAMAPTVLISAVAPETLTGWCDRVFTLARGKLTELATQPGRTTRSGDGGMPRRGDLAAPARPQVPVQGTRVPVPPRVRPRVELRPAVSAAGV